MLAARDAKLSCENARVTVVIIRSGVGSWAMHIVASAGNISSSVRGELAYCNHVGIAIAICILARIIEQRGKVAAIFQSSTGNGSLNFNSGES